MKWFYTWLLKKCQKALDNDGDSIPEPAKQMHQHIEAHGMNFTIHRANGGYVVEYNHYDRVKSEHVRNLHIITDDNNLGEKMSEIIIFENIRR